ncbi:hypothetical protein R1sor_012357 [Riccia sorocarpa]|uniref:Uncharacterized protein n=1 Tax=Riccia sorocarpa TaxID=122646 RepID=A0ABD3I4S1_9MARC
MAVGDGGQDVEKIGKGLEPFTVGKDADAQEVGSGGWGLSIVRDGGGIHRTYVMDLYAVKDAGRVGNGIIVEWATEGVRKVLHSRQLLRAVQEESRIVFSRGSSDSGQERYRQVMFFLQEAEERLREQEVRHRKIQAILLEAAGTVVSQFEETAGLERRSGGLATQLECEDDRQDSMNSAWSSTSVSGSEDRTSSYEFGTSV